MKVILLKDVENLGHACDVKEVSDGHARNFLFPHSLAIAATATSLAANEKKLKLLEEKRLKHKDEMQELARKIEQMEITFIVEAGEGGKLFGAITNKDISDKLKQGHSLEIDKHQIILEKPIKNIGKHTAKIKLHSDISPALKISIQSK